MDAPPASIGPRLRIASARFAVAELDASVGFYTRAIGLRVAARDDGVAELAAADGPPLLVLEQLEEPARPSPHSAGLFHLALLHPDRAALADTVRRIVGAGERFTGASDHGVSEALYLRDPDGLGLEIYADRPRERWPMLDGGRIDMYTAPLDLEDLLGASRNPPGPPPEIAAGTTIGHVHLQVGDLARSLAFYRDVIGLDLMATVPGAAFLSAAGYHHHLGINEWGTAGAEPAPDDAPRLRRVELALDDAKRVDALEQRLTDVDAAPLREVDGRLRVGDPDAVELVVAS